MLTYVITFLGEKTYDRIEAQRSMNNGTTCSNVPSKGYKKEDMDIEYLILRSKDGLSSWGTTKSWLTYPIGKGQLKIEVLVNQAESALSGRTFKLQYEI
uniref:Uncharacterized protein n=1 Tax=Megaselia scalaris TaxID=36166 RepID=T1GJW3_MEGSC